ncbi:hypothetical protein MRX96_044018 [Rhipicephalus microplus]
MRRTFRETWCLASLDTAADILFPLQPETARFSTCARVATNLPRTFISSLKYFPDENGRLPRKFSEIHAALGQYVKPRPVHRPNVNGAPLKPEERTRKLQVMPAMDSIFCCARSRTVSVNWTECFSSRWTLLRGPVWATLLHGVLGHRSTSFPGPAATPHRHMGGSVALYYEHDTPRPAVFQFLNEQCNVDDPAFVHGEIAFSITRPAAVSAEVPQSATDTPANMDLEFFCFPAAVFHRYP